MPLVISDDRHQDGLTSSQIRFLHQRLAKRQDVRAMRILFLNLMPHVLETELQVLRLLANTPLQVEVTLVRSLSSIPTPGGEQQLLDHYRSFDEVRSAQYDGAIIVGHDSEVGGWVGQPTWEHFAEVLNWTQAHVRSSLYIGWAARAAVSHFHDLLPWFLPERQVAAVVGKSLQAGHALLGGLDRHIQLPVARATRYDPSLLQGHDELVALVASEQFGVHILQDPAKRRLYIFDHIESSAGMFRRDVRKHAAALGRDPAVDAPAPNWRAAAHVLLANWLDVEVYQPLSLSVFADAVTAGAERSEPAPAGSAAPA